ncbi:hypothetical protein [Halobacillus aidingensis]|uniref:Uncharacterized protein n=1 Tax=Halobacillus aidingensis TaxID=240303 RepID=A0A1H0LXB0_HALAD|nr:hypothetical protein [Halobacillus aidingensis]SDO72580.1 hypothetical protein SAMN05421677_107147 [Halobacillus aidingensis]
MLGIILSSLPHIFIGALIASIIMVNDNGSFQNKIRTFVFCSVVVMSPDVLKVLGVLSSHALWLCPVLGMFFSITYVYITKGVNFFIYWIKLSTIILIGHLFIDFIGNGARLLYPFVKEEFIFSIVSKLDFIFIMFLALFMVVVLITPKKKGTAFVCLMIILMYFSSLTVSKIQLEYSLKEKYKSEDIVLLLSYPNESFHWSYQVRTTNMIVTGRSPVFSGEINVETKREF